MKLGTLLRSMTRSGLHPHWDTGWAVVLVLAGGLILSRNHADPDFWGHVQYGRDVLRHALPLTATYTYTGVGFPWINHENLAEIFFAWSVDHWGAWSLLAMKVATGWLLTALLWWRVRRSGVDILPGTILLILTLLNVTYFWTLRPQWFTLGFFAVLLSLLNDKSPVSNTAPTSRDKEEELDRMRHTLRWLLWVGPPIFIVWTNAHGGFVLGVLFLAAYLGLRCVELLWRHGRAALGIAVRAALLVGLIGASTWINPYGWQLHRWLVYSLGKARPEIAEWHPPALLDAVFIPWWILVVGSLAVICLTPARRDKVRCVLLAVTLWQALSHLRHIPFYALAFLWWFAADVALVWRRYLGRQPQHRTADSVVNRAPWWLWATAAAAAMVILGLTYRQVKEIPVHRDRFPVDALAFMAKHRLHGRLVARFDWAQYVLEVFANAPPEHQVSLAIDGRYDTCYPRWLLDVYFDFALGNDPRCRNRAKDSPPYDPLHILELGHPNLVLVGCDERYPARILPSQSAQWVLLYHDPVAEIWGRRSRYDDPQSPHYFPPEKRLVVREVAKGYVPWPAWPQFAIEAKADSHLLTTATVAAH